MKIAVAEVLSGHTTLELECVDRLYLNVYVPLLQTGAGASYFFRHGNPVPSLMAQMTRRFVEDLERFAQRYEIDILERKERNA